jgi:hypothetical protein
MKSPNPIYSIYVRILFLVGIITLLIWTTRTLGALDNTADMGSFVIVYMTFLLTSPFIGLLLIISGVLGITYQWLRPKRRWGLVGIDAYIPLGLLVIGFAILTLFGYYLINLGFTD